MKNKILSGAWVLAVAVGVSCSGCSRQPVAPAQLMGTVFIVTEGAQTFRLPLTTVEVVKAEDFRKYCKDVEAELAQLKASGLVKLKELNAKLAKERAAERSSLAIQMNELTELGENYAASAWSLYIGPKANAKASPVATGQTDADGKFRIQLPGADAYFVKAQAKRRVGEKTENYHWIVPVTVSVGKEATVDLSNQNLATKESLAGLIDFEKLGI